MDDERWEPGMPVLDRQPVRDDAPAPAAPGQVPAAIPAAAHPAAVRAPAAVPPSLQGLPLRSVPESAPTPLQKHFVLLSAPALIAGAVAITALEFGMPLGAPLIKACVVIAAPLLLVTTADATVRIWRSAWAWMPVDRQRGIFRLAWVLMSLIFLAVIVTATVLVLGA